MFGTETKKPDTGPEWFTLDQMAEAFDMTPQGFAKSIRPLVPEADIRAAGKRGAVRIRCRGAIDAFATKQAEKKKADPLLTGGDSPELERYRKARADLAELELGERNGSLINRTHLEPAFAAYAALVRRAGEALQRQFGNEAAVLLNEALDDAEAAIRQSFGEAKS